MMPNPIAIGPLSGVWVVVYDSIDFRPEAVFATELEARRHSDHQGYGEVYWWPWGDWAAATRDPPPDTGFCTCTKGGPRCNACLGVQ